MSGLSLWLWRRVAAVVAVIVVSTSPALVSAQSSGPLTGASTGADYAKATMDERQDWALLVANATLPNGSLLELAALAVKVNRCLNIALGVDAARGDRKRRGKGQSEQDKARAAAALVSLAEASAACVILTER